MGFYVASGFIAEYIPARKTSPLRPEGWWLNRWPFLGWLETFLKVAAWIYAAKTPVADSENMIPYGAALYKYEVWALVSLAILMVAAIGDRIFYREIISMIFVLPQMSSAVVVARALLKGRRAVSAPNLRLYMWLQFLGDLVKLVFFVVHDFKIKKVAKWILYTLQFYFFLCYGFALYADYESFGTVQTFKRVFS
ncbi:hypothetical protein NDN08_000707 [Rhodosorus marinus]|uniref:Uncharacterized protein n=1 Tax=Rhodosorus marinus TaxID=101924 RepID=A0AAV8UNR4_9RHOD|nr:hypothetical protein NDN08_000707 [Rhodosorus marinus]